MAAVLGDGNAAGVQTADSVDALVQLHMGVAEEEDAALGELGQVLRSRVMAVGQVENLAVGKKLAVLRKTGEGQHHLVHLCLAVAPDGQDPIFQGAEHGNHFLGSVIPGQVVPGTVVEKVPQKKHLVRVLPFDFFAEPAAPVGAAVNIGRNDEFHSHSPL